VTSEQTQRARLRSVPNETTDCVYIGHSERSRRFKIGHGDPPDRFNSHRTACPDIQFIGAVQSPNSYALEQRILAHFARWRVGKSEWLEDEPEVRKWVEHFAAHPCVANTYAAIVNSYILPDIWPWYADTLPEPSLEDENGQALLPVDVGPRDYQQQRGHGKGQTSSITEDWYTHPDVVEAVRELFGGTIDLDPFTCREANRTVLATRIFTAESDGLTHTWHGKLLLNPPWGGSGNSSVKKRAVAKLIRSYRDGTVTEAVAVLNANATTTQWFAPLFAYPMCFPAYRIPHYGPGNAGGSPNSGTVLIYLGPRIPEFAHIFSRFGNIVQRLEPASLTAMAAAEDWDPDEMGATE
jgi:T5orf172 domain